MVLDGNIIGTRHFTSKVEATDPSYDKDVWCRINDIEVVEGVYECIAWKDNEEERVFVCGIYLDGMIPNKSVKDYDFIGQVGVDAGLCGFFNDKPDFDKDEWIELCNKLGYDNTGWIIDSGFFTSSGWGDGCYDVYGYKTEPSAKYSALEIRFY